MRTDSDGAVPPLNSPFEIGMRAVAILEAFYPEALSIDALALLDYAVVHSADLNGPASLHPRIPGRVSEITVKRPLLEKGLAVSTRAGLSSLIIDAFGIRHVATDESTSFLSLLDSEYMNDLRDRARWLANEFTNAGLSEIQRRVLEVLGEHGEVRSAQRSVEGESPS